MKVSFNEYGQLVDEIKVRRLTSYLGTLVRNQHNVPLQVSGWSCVSIEAKEKIWAFVLVFSLIFLWNEISLLSFLLINS